MIKKRVQAKKKFCFGALISFVFSILAILGLITNSYGLITLILAIISITFGIIALAILNKMNRYGGGWAIAGIIISLVALILRYVLFSTF
jgi:hypothetical protein